MIADINIYLEMINQISDTKELHRLLDNAGGTEKEIRKKMLNQKIPSEELKNELIQVNRLRDEIANRLKVCIDQHFESAIKTNREAWLTLNKQNMSEIKIETPSQTVIDKLFELLSKLKNEEEALKMRLLNLNTLRQNAIETQSELEHTRKKIKEVVAKLDDALQ